MGGVSCGLVDKLGGRTHPTLQGFPIPCCQSSRCGWFLVTQGKPGTWSWEGMCTTGSLELFPRMPALHWGGTWSHQGPKRIEVKGVDSKVRQTGFKSQLWCILAVKS